MKGNIPDIASHYSLTISNFELTQEHAFEGNVWFEKQLIVPSYLITEIVNGKIYLKNTLSVVTKYQAGLLHVHP